MHLRYGTSARVGISKKALYYKLTRPPRNDLWDISEQMAAGYRPYYKNKRIPQRSTHPIHFTVYLFCTHYKKCNVLNEHYTCDMYMRVTPRCLGHITSVKKISLGTHQDSNSWPLEPATTPWLWLSHKVQIVDQN